MSDKENSEKMIGKLIKKRKAENEAFMKILQAIESKSQDSSGSTSLVTKKQANHKSSL